MSTNRNYSHGGYTSDLKTSENGSNLRPRQQEGQEYEELKKAVLKFDMKNINCTEIQIKNK